MYVSIVQQHASMLLYQYCNNILWIVGIAIPVCITMYNNTRVAACMHACIAPCKLANSDKVPRTVLKILLLANHGQLTNFNETWLSVWVHTLQMLFMCVRPRVYPVHTYWVRAACYYAIDSSMLIISKSGAFRILFMEYCGHFGTLNHTLLSVKESKYPHWPVVT